MTKDHIIKHIGEGGLAYCTRCHGGEAELDESCPLRLAKERNQLLQRINQLEITIVQLNDKIIDLEIPF